MKTGAQSESLPMVSSHKNSFELKITRWKGEYVCSGLKNFPCAEIICSAVGIFIHQGYISQVSSEVALSSDSVALVGSIASSDAKNV